MISVRVIILFLLFLGILSCQKDTELMNSNRDITAIALDHLTLTCDSTIESGYYIKGKIGEEEFCHYPAYEGYYAYTAIGNRFVTSSPSASTSNNTDYARYFYMGYNSDSKPDIPEETVSISVKLPNEGDFSDEFHKIMQIGELDYVNWESAQGGIIIRLDLLVRVNPGNEGHLGTSFSSALGDQTNSTFHLVEFTSNQAADHYYGDAKFEFSADLYYSKASDREGIWRRIEGEMVIPWILYE